jgi:hypothetical protein
VTRPLAIVLSLVALAGVAGCREAPLFEPDGFQLELLRHWDAETGGLRAGLERQWVCLSPQRPICYCEARDTERLLGGLPQAERLELNFASREQIEALPGIGPTLAERILEHRKTRPFRYVEDLMEVSGIGPGRFRRLEPLVRVDGPQSAAPDESSAAGP